MRLITTLLVSFCITVFSLSCKPKNQKPNVLLIMADDQGWGDISSNGNTVIQTPTLDQLKKESCSFERFYVSPLCAPTRASLLTGKYHTRTGTVGVTKGLERMNHEELTLAETFKQNGYQTAIFGKWHNGEHFPENPMGQGFDKFIGFCAGHWNNYFNSTIQVQDSIVRYKGYLPNFLINSAIEFISAAEKPFFCYIPLNTPHTPHQVPDEYFDKYKAKGLSDELASIYGMVENIDYNVNRLLASLKANKLIENTIVIYMSDNGPNGIRFNGNMKGRKGQVHEGGVRSPLFVKWKNKIEPKSTSQLAAHIDIFPTLRELCDLELNDIPDFDGISIAPHLLGSPPNTNREIYSLVTYDLNPDLSIPNEPASIRTNNFRWVKKNGIYELYNMNTDPGEQINLIDSLPHIHHEMKLKHESWFNEVTANLNLEDRKTIPIGYQNAGVVYMQAPQASFTGGVKFIEGHGWANDWLTNFTAESKISWKVESISKQTYQLFLQYAALPNQVGSSIQVDVGHQKKEVTLTQPFIPEKIPSPDRVKRKEAYEQTWGELYLGSFTIPKGSSKIELSVLDAESASICDVKSIILK